MRAVATDLNLAATLGPAPPPSPEVLAARRQRLLDSIAGGVAVVPSAPELLKSRDTEIVYRPASDLFYLTGFTEPDSVAVLTPHTDGHRFVLFLRPRDPDREVWSGGRMGVEAAAEAVGADAAYPIAELPTRLPELVAPADRVYYPIGERPDFDAWIADILIRSRRTRQRSGRGPVGVEDLESVTGPLRMVKDASEIDRLRIAAEITAAGHLAAMRSVRPGAGEWEMQAALESTFRSHGGAIPAFPSIVGAGANATVLHYVANDGRAGEGDLVLIDAGAEWGMYCADITRTFPVSGRFSPEQRALYDVVLAAEEAGIAAAAPGAPVSAIHDAALRVLVQGMLDLRLLPPGELDGVIESGAYRRFYMHQTSHWLGLDVHDAGPYMHDGAPLGLRPGHVLTVEPGIYVPATADDVPSALRGVGVRIEDNVVITAEGREVLTRGVPVAASAIEEILAQR